MVTTVQPMCAPAGKARFVNESGGEPAGLCVWYTLDLSCVGAQKSTPSNFHVRASKAGSMMTAAAWDTKPAVSAYVNVCMLTPGKVNSSSRFKDFIKKG